MAGGLGYPRPGRLLGPLSAPFSHGPSPVAYPGSHRHGIHARLSRPGRPVPSRRSEVVRERIEDYGILLSKQALTRNSGTPLAEEAGAHIQHLLDVSPPEMLDQSLKGMMLGLRRSAMDASNNDETVAALRRGMIECVEAVTKQAERSARFSGGGSQTGFGWTGPNLVNSGIVRSGKIFLRASGPSQLPV